MDKESEDVRLCIRDASVKVPLPPLDDMALLQAGEAMVKDLIENWSGELRFAAANKRHAMIQGRLKRKRFVVCENIEDLPGVIAEAIRDTNYITLRNFAA